MSLVCILVNEMDFTFRVRYQHEIVVLDVFAEGVFEVLITHFDHEVVIHLFLKHDKMALVALICDAEAAVLAETKHATLHEVEH